MNNRRMFIIIFLVWIAERLAQSVFFYNFSVALPMLTSFAFFAVRLKTQPWPLFAGGAIFDLSSGLPFGVITLVVAAVCLIIILGQRIMNFFDSLPLFLIAAAVFSSVGWAVVIWLSEVPFNTFVNSVIIIVVEAILISLVLQSQKIKPKLTQLT